MLRLPIIKRTRKLWKPGPFLLPLGTGNKATTVLASFPGSSPAFCFKIRFHHVQDDILCVVLCMVLVIKLLPTHVVFDLLDATQYDSEESLEDHNEQL